MDNGNMRQLPSLADRADGDRFGLPVGGWLGKIYSVRGSLFTPILLLLRSGILNGTRLLRIKIFAN